MILRFLNNCIKRKKSGSLTTAELVNQTKFYIKREQEKVVSSDRFEDDKKRLNLEKNDEGVYVCNGGLQEFYPVYLPEDPVLSTSVLSLIIIFDTTFKMLIKVGNKKRLWM